MIATIGVTTFHTHTRRRDMERRVYQQMASLIDAYHRCVKTGNKEWKANHAESLRKMVNDYLPSGSGVELELDASTGEKIVLALRFHHMNEDGYYDGWTDHVVTVRPSLQHGFVLAISGRDRNNIKEYLYGLLQSCLDGEVQS